MHMTAPILPSDIRTLG